MLKLKKKDKLEREKPTSLLLEERRTLSYLEKLKFIFSARIESVNKRINLITNLKFLQRRRCLG